MIAAWPFWRWQLSLLCDVMGVAGGSVCRFSLMAFLLLFSIFLRSMTIGKA